MGLFQSIKDEAQKRNLRFLVIGGLAVNMHHFSHDTADLDLLVLKDARDAWLDVFAKLGYEIFQDRGVFLQLTPPVAGAWPVDLMFVPAETFTQTMSAALEVDMFGVRMLIPCLDHLLALKVHALKHGHVGRFGKDLLDVDNLVRINKVDFQSDKFRQCASSMATKNSTEKLFAPVAASEAACLRDSPGGDTLAFPVDPGFMSYPPQIDPQAMLQRIAETMPWRSTRPGERERRAALGVAVEFVL